MKLVSEMRDRDAAREFRRFLEATGTENWQRKVEKLNALPKFPAPSPNLYKNYLASRNPLVRPIETYLKLDRSGKSIWKNLDPLMIRACGYLKVLNAVFHVATGSGSIKAMSMVLDDETVRSFLFEIDLATHFFQLGHDVQFIDLEDKGTYDLLVSNGQHELEVECKTKSADAGRKITRGGLYLLWDVLVARLAPLKERFALMIKCDGRLSLRQQLYEKLAREVKRSLASRRDQGKIEDLGFNIVPLDPKLRIRNQGEAAAALTPYWKGSAHYFVFSNGATFVVGCESTQRDRVLKAIYEELKRGAEQLSEYRPGMLACFIEDIDDEDWTQLTGNSGLANMTHEILAEPNRRHVNFVSYSSDHTPQKKEGGITTFPATYLRFDNPNPKYSIPISFLRRD